MEDQITVGLEDEISIVSCRSSTIEDFVSLIFTSATSFLCQLHQMKKVSINEFDSCHAAVVSLQCSG